MRKSLKAIAYPLIGLAALASAWAPANAIPGRWYDVTYFSDASMTQVIGEASLDCFGNRDAWGTNHGAYQVRLEGDCINQGCPNFNCTGG